MSPSELVVVAGTGTGVGKTHVACRMLRAARAAGRTVAVRKPAQSFSAVEAATGRTDAALLAAASGEAPHDVCPASRWYPVAMAPPMAADALGRPEIRLRDLIDELRWPAGIDLAMVETAGGVRSPLAHDGDTVDLVRILVPSRVILVADAALGALHAVRSALDALGGASTTDPVAVRVLLNRFDPHDELHDGNRRWLVERYGLDVVTDAAAALA